MSILLEDDYNSKFYTDNLVKSAQINTALKRDPILNFLDNIIDSFDILGFLMKIFHFFF